MNENDQILNRSRTDVDWIEDEEPAPLCPLNSIISSSSFNSPFLSNLSSIHGLLFQTPRVYPVEVPHPKLEASLWGRKPSWYKVSLFSRRWRRHPIKGLMALSNEWAGGIIQSKGRSNGEGGAPRRRSGTALNTRANCSGSTLIRRVITYIATEICVQHLNKTFAVFQLVTKWLFETSTTSI